MLISDKNMVKPPACCGDEILIAEISSSNGYIIFLFLVLMGIFMILSNAILVTTTYRM